MLSFHLREIARQAAMWQWQWQCSATDAISDLPSRAQTSETTCVIHIGNQSDEEGPNISVIQYPDVQHLRVVSVHAVTMTSPPGSAPAMLLCFKSCLSSVYTESYS